MASHRSQGLWYVARHVCAQPALLTDHVQAKVTVLESLGA